MEYFLYLVGGVIGISSVVLIFQPEKGKKVVYNIIYLLPFWIWGILILLLSALIWYYRTISSLPSLSYLISILFFVLGLLTLFFPKRKIKKKLEWFLALEEKKIRIIAVVSLIFGLLMILSV